MPSLGADMEEGTLVAWRVHPGDPVRRGDIVAVVQTDKSDIEVEVFETGTITELLVEEGETVAVGTPLARIEAADATDVTPAAGAPVSNAAAPTPTPLARPTAAPVRVASTQRGHAARVLSPLVRRDAAALGVDLATVRPADPDGQIHRSDVAAAAAARSAEVAARFGAASPYARRLAAERGIALGAVHGTGPGGAVVARDLPSAAPSEPLDPMRAAIARTMERANREIPHYYLAHTVDVAATTAWLAERNADRLPADRLLLAALELRAVALAAHGVGELNGTWVDGRFVPGDGVHIGVIVALRGGGLLAPVLRDADRLDLDATMAALADLVERARRGALRGALRSSELTGATISVTNLGEDGVEEIFGVIHPPQVAIVGFGGVIDRPVALDGQPVVHPTVRVTLAGDHRASDGRSGGRFLAKVSSLLAHPTKL